ncbi:MAG: uracil-DNA glycosylase family protein [Planctomycetota bacterium]|nr:uracil-DNA glycosylase family protein [Planctomycetota bacterium]MEC8652790.1 uracil-DNA glycosylase family protein [Planctomycetota bacterium]MEC9047772.1 uracil-DNA glycosylase family protein [Planctomycetota bacterium]
MSLTEIVAGATPDFERLTFSSPVACVYNPLTYAWELHRQYLERFGRGRKEVVLLGMNPGPFGMVQTGVPFGEVAAVKDWMKIRGEVAKPATEHEKRPILGLASTRSEVSGRRLWGWAGQRFGTPAKFARRFFVYNYCPLAFLGESGANLTPDKLKKAEAAPLFDVCDGVLRAVVAELQPKWLVGVGVFAEERIKKVFRAELDAGDVRVGRIPHPSPASPAANRGWERLADEAFAGLDIAVG